MKEKILSNPNHIDLVYTILSFGDKSLLLKNKQDLLNNILSHEDNTDFEDLRDYFIKVDMLMPQNEYIKQKMVKIEELSKAIDIFIELSESEIDSFITASVKDKEESLFLSDQINFASIISDFKKQKILLIEKLSSNIKDEHLYLTNLQTYFINIKEDLKSSLESSLNSFIKGTLGAEEEVKVRIVIKDSLDDIDITYLAHKEVIFGEINFSDYKKIIDLKIHSWIKNELGDSIESISLFRTSPLIKGVEHCLTSLTLEEFLTEHNSLVYNWNNFFENDPLKQKILSKIQSIKDLKSLIYDDFNILRKKIDAKFVQIHDLFKSYDIEDISIEEIVNASYSYNLKEFVNLNPEVEIEKITNNILSGDIDILSKNIPFFIAQKMSKEVSDKLKKSIIITLSKGNEFNFKKQYHKECILSESEMNNKFITNTLFTHRYKVITLENDEYDQDAKSFKEKLSKKESKKTGAFLFRDIEIEGKIFNVDCLLTEESLLHKDASFLK